MRTKALLITLASLLPIGIASTVPQVQLPFEMKSSSPSPLLSLTDLLTRSKNSRIFYDYLRDSSSVSTRLANPLESTTILAPVNSAIIALERRPHQGPPEPAGGYVQGYAGSRQDEQERADYLEKWIKRHLIAGKVDLEEESKEYESLLGGDKVSFARKDQEGQAGYKVMPGDVQVVEIEQASNGVIFYLQGTLNLDTVD
ncbi:hypothetical protein JCM5350_000498 [Sporobolomyces pararoseus]